MQTKTQKKNMMNRTNIDTGGMAMPQKNRAQIEKKNYIYNTKRWEYGKENSNLNYNSSAVGLGAG